MSDLIKKTDAVKAIFSKPAWHSSDGSYYHSSDIKDAINNLPSTERPKGKWIKGKIDDEGVWYCSNCRHIDDYYGPTANYCWYCGADMRGNQDVKR